MIPAGCAASVGAGDQEREQYGIFIWKKEKTLQGFVLLYGENA